jgi:carboxylesterase type B
VKGFPWAPTIDGEILTDTPYNLLRNGKFHRKDALLGANKDEGSFWILPELPGFTRHGPSLQNYTMYRQAVDVIAWDLKEDQVIGQFLLNKRCCQINYSRLVFIKI